MKIKLIKFQINIYKKPYFVLQYKRNSIKHNKRLNNKHLYTNIINLISIICLKKCFK